LKTTIEIPDPIWQRAKSYATEERRSLASVVAEALDRMLPRYALVRVEASPPREQTKVSVKVRQTKGIKGEKRGKHGTR
jgi:hypothetical protein